MEEEEDGEGAYKAKTSSKTRRRGEERREMDGQKSAGKPTLGNLGTTFEGAHIGAADLGVNSIDQMKCQWTF